MLMTWLLVWIASIGVPAAMRPITGTAIGGPPSSSDRGRRGPGFASLTAGGAARRRGRGETSCVSAHARGGGEAARAAGAEPARDGLGQLDHLDGARHRGD